MKKIIAYLSLLILCTSCDAILAPDCKDVEFIVFNKSNENIKNVKIYLEDEATNSKIEVLTFDTLKAKDSSALKSINLEKISKMGKGKIRMYALVENSKDKISNVVGIYDKYKLYQGEAAPSYWCTIEMVINNTADKKPPIFFWRYAYYKNGKYVKRYGN